MAWLETHWTLHRKGPRDQARHRQKVNDAIKQNLGELISDESIIMSDGKTIVRVPVRSMKEYRFRFSPYKNEHVGQGYGKTQVGDVLAKGKKGLAGKQGQAGQEEGEEIYEAEVSVHDLQETLFADLELPRLRRKKDELEQTSIRFQSIRKKGVFSNLDKRRTVLENIRRNARRGRPIYSELKDEDLRFRSWDERRIRDHKAVVICMRDISGSMGEFKKMITRTMVFWMLRFLRSRYEKVQVVFITHHIHARQVEEHEFFHLGENGGTRVSSAYELAREVIDLHYPPSAWNIYVFHFSDGDNWGDSDNRLCVDLVQDLLNKANLFGYGEINEGGYLSPLMGAFRQIREPHFVTVHMKKSEDVLTALRAFFGKEGVKAGAG